MNKFSLLICILLSGLLIFQSFSQRKWESNRVIIHDVTGFYSFLPALLIYDDLSFSYRHNLPDNEPVEGIWVNVEDDVTFLKAGIGMSYFYLPSFYLSHWYASNSDLYQANGYSLPYQFGMAMNTLLLAILGLFLIRFLLLRFSNDRATALALLILTMGSNLIYYVAYEPGMSHIYSMVLLTMVLLLMFECFSEFRKSSFLLLCFLSGWLIGIRATNVILLMIPLIFSITRQNRIEFWDNLLKRPVLIMGGLMVGILPLLPQFAYWYHTFDSWIVYSYADEKFFFNKPHVVDGLFGARTGFFIYTPLMLVGAIGLFAIKPKEFRRIVLLVVLIFVYLTFSWWCWWYGGYSVRTLIEVYPFLMIGLALAAEWILKQKMWLRIPAAIIVVFFLFQNGRFIDLYNRGVLHWDSMTWGNYKAIFWNNDLPDNYYEMFEQPDYDKAFKEGEDLFD